jgi:hypothetical protein
MPPWTRTVLEEMRYTQHGHDVSCLAPNTWAFISHYKFTTVWLPATRQTKSPNPLARRISGLLLRCEYVMSPGAWYL